MPSPFPGMDPFLEDHRYWATFQQQFMVALSDALLSAISDRYRVKPSNRLYETELVLFTSIQKEQQREPFLEIRQRGSTDKLITLLDLVSPVNRSQAPGRKAYQQFEAEAKRQGAHIVQMDLVLQGQSPIDVDRSVLLDSQYILAVHRHPKYGKPEVYGVALNQRLPRMRVPLLPDDRDLILDVQALVNRVYDRCFDTSIDYTKPLPSWLSDTEKKWASLLLEEHFKKENGSKI